MVKKKDVVAVLLEIAKHIAKNKEGALFIVGPEEKLKGKYTLMFPQLVRGNIMTKGASKVVEKLATLDGAVIVSNNGKLLAYGARIREAKTLRGFGTRHAAAAGITSQAKGSTAIVVSEESGWIRVFRNGKIILETDATEIPKSAESKIVSYIATGDKAFLSSLAGAGVVAAMLGASQLVAPIMVVGGVYLLIRTTAGIIRKKIKMKKSK